MSITDELRKYVQGWRDTPNLMDDLDAGDIDGLLGDFEHIADLIDAEHESEINIAAQLLDDAEKERDFNYADWQDCKQKVLQHNITIDELDAEIERLKDELAHCIALPVDADGKVIRIGDVMEFIYDPPQDQPLFEVSGFGADGTLFYALRGEVLPRKTTKASVVRHHKQPTVEDVLTEMLYKAHIYDEREMELLPDLITEYAAKLQLRGDTE